MAYQPKPDDLAGFDLVGFRQPDGRVYLGEEGGAGTNLPDFPAEVEMLGKVYTLEEVKKNREMFDLDEDHPGYNIEWGIYV